MRTTRPWVAVESANPRSRALEGAAPGRRFSKAAELKQRDDVRAAGERAWALM